MKKLILFISIPFLFVLFITSFLYFYDFRTDEEMIVAVLDTGVDKDHELLQGKVLDGLDLLDYNFDATDPSGHGTHIAGIIVLNNPEAKILPIRMLKDEKEELWELKDSIAVLYAIIRGADVINMSYTTQENPWLNYMINFAVAKGVIFVSSAGNDGEETISYPASHEHVISVGNSFQDRDVLYKDSNYAKEIDVVAPGYNIKSSDIHGEYSKKTGTSMSSAYVSGVVSYLLQHHDVKRIEEIKQLLQRKSREAIFSDEEELFYRYPLVSMERIKSYVKKDPYLYVSDYKNLYIDDISGINLIIETEHLEEVKIYNGDTLLVQLIPTNNETIKIRINEDQLVAGDNVITIIGKSNDMEIRKEKEIYFVTKNN